jgi:hypothetical protein
MLKPKATKNSKIILNGTVGQFQTINSNYRIRYISTKANAQTERDFLSLLKPMRESVSPQSILDIESILQRDLDDVRISEKIIPYLLNENNGIQSPTHLPFFSSVLAVIMPKNYLVKEELDYPNDAIEESTGNDVQKITYNEDWSLDIFFDEGVSTSMGTITIDKEKTDFLVLDGQHRANAFRAISGVFPQSNGVYEEFYKTRWKGKLPINLEADLPVIILWFENISGGQINAKELVRDLFISINQNAKPISLSRKILLNDSNPNNFLTRCFYTYILNNKKFDLNELSLFHLGLDFDDDLRNNKLGVFDVFAPETIDYAFDFFYFSKSRYSIGQGRVNDKYNSEFSAFTSYFESPGTNYFDTFDNDFDEKEKIIKFDINKKHLSDYLQTCSEFGRVYNLFSSFPIMEKYLQGVKDIAVLYEQQLDIFASPDASKTFKEIICGEQGLYYSLRRSKVNKKNHHYWKYVVEIEELIEKNFKSYNSDLVNTISRMQTKVFPISLLAACEYYNKENSLALTSSDEFILRLKEVPLKKWIKAFSDFWNKYIGQEIKPSVWPLVTNIILRVIQKNGSRELFAATPVEKSPDYSLLSKAIDDAINSFRSQNLGKVWSFCKIDDFDIKTLNNIFNTQLLDLEIFFRSCEMELISDLNPLDIGWDIIYKQLKLDGQEKNRHVMLRN